MAEKEISYREAREETRTYIKEHGTTDIGTIHQNLGLPLMQMRNILDEFSLEDEIRYEKTTEEKKRETTEKKVKTKITDYLTKHGRATSSDIYETLEEYSKDIQIIYVLNSLIARGKIKCGYKYWRLVER